MNAATIASAARPASRPTQRRSAAATNLSRDFGRALRVAMRTHIISLGGVPMMYQVEGLTVESATGSRMRVNGGVGTCTVTALFPGVQVRAYSDSPGGWFARIPIAGFRAHGTAVVCSAGAVVPEMIETPSSSIPALL
ncbi:MAG: hypothetical protein JO306_02255 [Gemmatimonadetes bacterium]|nr:hypothetical protein [Gemmatimonadota bacterium]